MFKSKEKSSPGVTAAADPYGDVREGLNKYLSDNIGKTGTPYTGETVAPMSSQEEESMKSLDAYKNRTASDSTKAARTMAVNTLEGDYDPTKSAAYQAVKAEAMRSLGQQQDAIKDASAGGGRYYTGARLQQQREAGTDVVNRLSTIMGEGAEAERNRQVSMVPVAAALGESEELDPLKTTEALQTYGSLPRVIQQAQDEADLQEFLRTNYDFPMSIAQIAAGVQQAPLYTQNYMKPSLFSSIMQGLTPAGMMGLN
jgi:hypothetical protein